VFVSVPRDCLQSVLASVDWPGDLSRVVPLLERFSHESHWFDVDFSIGADRTEPTLSFYREFFAPRMADGTLCSVLGAIADSSMISKGRTEAVARWVVANDARTDRLVTFKVTVLPDRSRLKLYLSALNREPSRDGNAPR
jgi:hypothetical protein